MPEKQPVLPSKMSNLRPEAHYTQLLDYYMDSIEHDELEALAKEERVKHRLNEVLNHDGEFIDLDMRYEVVDSGQIMRALRSLDEAIRGYVKLTESAGRISPECDAVFTSLSRIQTNLKKAVENEQT